MNKFELTGHAARSTRQLLGVRCIADGCADTRNGLLAFFVIQPTNLNVLPQESVAERIRALLDVIKGLEAVELLALSASESFEGNQRFYRERLQSEPLPALRRLLAQDAAYLENFRASLASARQFCVVVRLRPQENNERQAYLSRIEKSIRDSGFRLHRANDQELRRLLALYFEQDVTTTYFEKTDGERWLAERGVQDEDRGQTESLVPNV